MTDATEYGPCASELLDHSQSKTFPHKDNKPNLTDAGLLVNIQGLTYKHMTKVNYLNDLANMNNLFFMALTETHLSHNILDAEININDFNILRQDRQNRSHGGVLLYIRKNTVTNTLSSNSNQFCDYLLVEIPEHSLIIGVVYRPPNCPKTKFIPQMADISQKVNNFQRQKGVHYNFLFMGYFNFPFCKKLELFKQFYR